MKKYPDLEIFEDIAIELGVDPSFVEKDWFATQILIEIAKIESPEIVFAGGTSLSKGYNLIRRFSEDLDFRICTPIQLSRNDRKVIRAGIISKVNNIADVLIIHDSMRSQNESNFFSFNVEYPHIFPKPESLRPHLKLEFSFEKPCDSYMYNTRRIFLEGRQRLSGNNRAVHR
jgi:predicted nucleotidyltransferase component of viral defense system